MTVTDAAGGEHAAGDRVRVSGTVTYVEMPPVTLRDPATGADVLRHAYVLEDTRINPAD